jgi:hypothetical protein
VGNGHSLKNVLEKAYAKNTVCEMIYGKAKYYKQMMENIFPDSEDEYLGDCYEVFRNTEVVQQEKAK